MASSLDQTYLNTQVGRYLLPRLPGQLGTQDIISWGAVRIASPPGYWSRYLGYPTTHQSTRTYGPVHDAVGHIETCIPRHRYTST